jgi:hypothetical protein
MICRGLEFFFYRLKREALAMQTCFKKVKKKKKKTWGHKLDRVKK